MSVVAVAVAMGLLVALLLRTRAVRAGSAVVCVLFGLVLGLTPLSPVLADALNASGAWVWVQVSAL